MPARADDTACPDSSPANPTACVEVFVQDARSVTLTSVYSVEHLVAMQGEPVAVPIRDSKGYSSGDALRGVQITTLLGTLAGSTTFVEIERSDHPTPTLLDQAAPFTDLSKPKFVNDIVPLVQINNANLSYTRPLRNKDTDINATEQILPGTGPLKIIAHITGRVLHPTIAVRSKAPITTRSMITFSATVSKATPTMTYSWDFGDGKPATGQTVTRTFGTEGTYRPAVVVSDPADSSYGRSLLDGTITIGTPSKDPGPAGPPVNGTATTPAPSTGPKRGSGTRSGGGPTTAGGSGDRPGNGAGTAASVGPGGQGANASGTAAPRSGAPSRGRSSAASDGGAGTLVSGQLLLAPPGAVPAAGPSEDPGQASAAAARRASTSSLDLRWLWSIVPIALVGLGVFGERRRPRRQGSAS